MWIFIVIVFNLWFGNAVETDPRLAIAQAEIESARDEFAVSRVEAGKRHVGHWAQVFPSTFAGPYFCGLWQTEAYSEAECMQMRSPLVAYLTRRNELRAWLSYCHGDAVCMWDGYGCGVQGALTKRCNAYAERVLFRASQISPDRS